jgi:hypothetical protein
VADLVATGRTDRLDTGPFAPDRVAGSGRSEAEEMA